MGRPSLALVDDPGSNHDFDLRRALERRCPAHLVLVVEPVQGGAPAGTEAPAASGAEASLAAACAATAGAPVELRRYRASDPTGKGDGNSVVLGAGEVVEKILHGATGRGVVIGWVNLATLPLFEALHAEPGTQPLLKIGVTSPRLDADYNLAQKLVAAGKLHAHEHSPLLGRMLGPRIATLLRAPAPGAAAFGPAT